MILKELLKGIKYLDVRGSIDVEIKGLSQKIDNVQEGFLFFCFKGVNNDGHDFINLAQDKGAVALIVEKFVQSPLPQILVKKTRNIMPKICNNFFGNIKEKLKFIGVTGTNGKTTTTHIIYNILNKSGKKAGLIGTNGVFFGKKKLPLNLTTPDTVELFYILNDMNTSSIEYVVMEVSAHAIALNKLKGLKFEVGLFTNLTQDHLDYFKTMHNYALAKLKFLNKSYCKHIILNTDDDYGKLFKKLINANMTTFALDNPADCFAIDINLNLHNTSFVANVKDDILIINSPLPCLFNVYNLLGAIICCKELGINNNSIISSIKELSLIEGRMNAYKLSCQATAIIDFAHTPDGLEKVLLNLKDIKEAGNIITVFGCGGNRDKLKRSKMGEVASIYSDKIILTNDNPRYEKPQDIINDIIKGIKNKPFEVEINRKKAIEKAIEQAKPNDIILIAGKGAENYQEINGIKHKYNDKNVLKKYLI